MFGRNLDNGRTFRGPVDRLAPSRVKVGDEHGTPARLLPGPLPLKFDDIPAFVPNHLSAPAIEDCDKTSLSMRRSVGTSAG